MSESLLLGKLPCSLLASSLNFALSSKMQVKICCREEFHGCKLHRMEKICLELQTFEEFATAVLQTLPRYACDHFFKSHD